MTNPIGNYILGHDWAIETIMWTLLACVATIYGLLGYGIYCLGRRAGSAIARRRALRRTPAAPDNQPGTDAGLLWACRYISSQPLADPELRRRADQYLRNQQRKEKP